MRNNPLIGVFILSLTFLLVSCDEHSKLTYKEGFPAEYSPALTDFMGYHFVGMNDNLLSSSRDHYIYAERNGSFEDKKVSYFQYTTEQLKQYYKPMFNSDQPQETFDKLFQKEDKELHHTIETAEQGHLPDIKKETGNRLTIETASSKKEVSLASETKQISKDDEIRFNLVSSNSEGFVLHLQNSETKVDYYLFALQDLSDIAVYEDSDLDESGEAGELEPFYPILDDVGDNYKKLKPGQVINADTNQVQKVAKTDVMSEDFKYIYVDGNEDPLKDGKQRILRVDDYFTGNDKTEAVFKISFKKIAKELDFRTSGINKAKVKYFNKDYIVLRLSYDGKIVGKAGAVNVIADLQDKENPTAYIVDLGWE